MQILYFAWVRETIGCAGEEVSLPADVTTVAQLLRWLTARGPRYAEALADVSRLRAAVDQVFVAMDAPLGDAQEVAIFPPVTGG